MDFAELPKNHFGAIYCDPPWSFETWSDRGKDRAPPYQLMFESELAGMDVKSLAADDCVLFLWVTWPMLQQALSLINEWEFQYKTCAFSWTKANAYQIDMFRDDLTPSMGLGYWTRSNSEPCLLATRGKPKRLSAGVRQAIIEPRREHSRKPECVYERIERLVDGPYLELFARQTRQGWMAWGNEVNKWDSMWQKPFDKPDLL